MFRYFILSYQRRQTEKIKRFDQTRFDLYSVILFCCFYWGNRGKPTGKIHFSRLRVRSASLAYLRMRICYQNNGGSMFVADIKGYLYKLLGKPLIESLMYYQGRRSGSKRGRAHFALAHT